MKTLEIEGTDPPSGYSTETKFLLQPIPFSVRAYDPLSLLAGKMHAVSPFSSSGERNRIVVPQDWVNS